MSSKIYKREFLNVKEGTAFSEVSGETGENYIDARLKVSDCNRTVELDFSVYDETNKTRRDRIAKADKLIAQLHMLRAFLQANPF